jgi:hypothetical protein
VTKDDAHLAGERVEPKQLVVWRKLRVSQTGHDQGRAVEFNFCFLPIYLG